MTLLIKELQDKLNPVMLRSAWNILDVAKGYQNFSDVVRLSINCKSKISH